MTSPSVRSVSAMLATVTTLVLAADALAGPVPPDYQFQWSTITHPGNSAYPGEPNSPIPEVDGIGRGSVAYEYRMSKWEIRTSDWVEFVNTFSVQADFPSILFGSTSFTRAPADIWGGSLDAFYNGPGRKYRVLAGQGDRPVFGITWREAALYCNWLNGGKSSDAESLWTGAYDTSSWGQSGIRYTDDLHHEPGALFWIPTLDEWLKAVYWDPANAQRGGWWTQPNGSDIAPVTGWPGEPGAETSHLLNDLFGAPQVPLGVYPGSLTPWGLLDSSSGASEWVEEPLIFDGLLDERGAAGAAAGVHGTIGTSIGRSDGSGHPNGGLLFSFRIASAVPPAPTICVMLALGGCSLLRRARACVWRTTSTGNHRPTINLYNLIAAACVRSGGPGAHANHARAPSSRGVRHAASGSSYSSLVAECELTS